jgi:hypothetical protein
MLIDETNLSLAWARAFLQIVDHPGTKISPLIVSLTEFGEDGTPEEDDSLRAALNECLVSIGEQEVHTVANTIFSPSLYRLSKFNRHRLYEIYLETLPRYKALSIHKNRRGLYFERLIAFGSGPCNGNQLEYIIQEYTSNTGVRRSMLQASVFDPPRDHVRSAQLGFPCLQHVSFVPEGGELVLNAFYATQQIFDKAYGNYLGLCRLGQFMAAEMGLRFGRMNCFTGVEKFDKRNGVSKTSTVLRPLLQAARECVAHADTTAHAAANN